MSEQQHFWNEKFDGEEHLYGTEPNAYIKEKSGLINAAGKVLCLGEGEGRNALFLAKEGHDIVAIDASEVGLAKAHRLTQAHGHTIDAVQMDLAKWNPEGERFDAVVTSYLHLPQPLRNEVFRKSVTALKPGGFFIGEFFSQDQLKYTSGGPKALELLYTVEDLANILDRQPVEIVHLDKEITHLDEGRGHQGKASVIRVIFKKLKK